jgi:hypothetical protein
MPNSEPARRGVRTALAAVALALAAACSPRQAAGPALPPGAHVQADVAALAALLGAFDALAATPAGQRAAELRQSLPACALATGADASGDLLGALRNLRCELSAPPGLVALRGAHAIGFAAPLRAGREALRGWIDVAPDGRVSAELTLPRDAAPAALAALLPGAEPAGPALFSGGESLIRARLRPEGGLALAELVPAQSQGDQLFHLRSALFGSLVLDGSLELAVYLPAAPARWPRVALALGVRNRALAEKALQGFLSELRASWPLPQRETTIAGQRASCLPELRLLPELAPCAQVGERALALGWNAESLAHALGSEPAELGEVANRAGGAALAVELASIPEADALLAGATPDASAAPPRYRRLLAGGAPTSGGHSLWFELEAQASAQPPAAPTARVASRGAR